MPISLAAMNGKEEMVTLLLDAGADLSTPGRVRVNPPQHALSQLGACSEGSNGVMALRCWRFDRPTRRAAERPMPPPLGVHVRQRPNRPENAGPRR